MSALLNGTNRGRPFAKGNPGGPGNPFARQINALRAQLYAAVTEQDMAEVVQALLAGAKAGKLAYIRELLDRLIGKPPQAIQLSGDDEAPPLSLSLSDLQLVVWDLLADHPELKAQLADRLRAMLHERQRSDPRLDRPA
jgi:hypothetical protein